MASKKQQGAVQNVQQMGIVAQRRIRVADLYRQHVKLTDIAEVVGVSVSTISRDVQAIVKGWQEEAREDIAALRARELAELDRMEADYILHIAEALRLRDEVVPLLRRDMPLAEQGAREPVKRSPAWERYDRSAREWAEKRMRVKERRAKLMNLDLELPPTNINTVIPITFIERGPVVGRDRLEDSRVIEGEVLDGSGS
jgi:hypothetical protein